MSTQAGAAEPVQPTRRDVHSFSNPELVKAKHLELDLSVDFQTKILTGTATWTIERQQGAPATAPLILDTRGITIDGVDEGAGNGAQADDFRPAKYELGKSEPIFGSPLTITLSPGTTRVRISYKTSPEASGLQWLDPAGTAGKKDPFLFSQSQAIHARSWVPCQDSPGVRFTYEATVHAPKGLVAVMAADTPKGQTRAEADGSFRFSIKQPIPSYLMALAVGDLVFRPLGPRTGVVAEPSMLAACVFEFADVEKMIDTVEKRFGPYRWGRYDILVLPPSFPFGGMENPKLTFATPTILAGDRSLVALIAHELAHSWSGNLVTNATWRDFWLNEGFTTYLEGRITEEIYGKERADMDDVLALAKLQADMKKIPPPDQILHIDLSGRDPDDGVTSIAYDKGALFIKSLEEAYGREKFDVFLKAYFDHFAFQSITTDQFVEYLKKNLLEKPIAEFQGQGKAAGLTAKAFDPAGMAIDLNEWLEKPGLPKGYPVPKSTKLEAIDRIEKDWIDGKLDTNDLEAEVWSTQEWMRFLESLPEKTPTEKLTSLDKRYGLTAKGNAEIVSQWLLVAVRNQYTPADEKLENFLMTVGRRKFIVPLYTEMKKTPEGLARAKAIFAKAKSGYHPIAAETIGKLLSK